MLRWEFTPVSMRTAYLSSGSRLWTSWWKRTYSPSSRCSTRKSSMRASNAWTRCTPATSTKDLTPSPASTSSRPRTTPTSAGPATDTWLCSRGGKLVSSFFFVSVQIIWRWQILYLGHFVLFLTFLERSQKFKNWSSLFIFLGQWIWTQWFA